MSRNLDYENTLYEIEDSSVLNSYFLLSLMNELKQCTINQLATALYLFRFTNITTKILEEWEEARSFQKGLSVWDTYNLDTVLAPYLLEKYNDRFKKGFMSLVNKGLIQVTNDYVYINESKIKPHLNLLENKGKSHHKAKYIKLIINKIPEEKLDDHINKFVGEINSEE